MSVRRTPSTCPVCDGDLITTRLGCEACGTELVGTFARCTYCSLDDDQHELLRVFLTSRGNMRELEKHLGVSYPTARARFNALLAKLGLASDDAAEDGAVDDETPDISEPDGADETEATSTGAAASGTVRDQVLAQVASGAIPPDVAADLLRRLA